MARADLDHKREMDQRDQEIVRLRQLLDEKSDPRSNGVPDASVSQAARALTPEQMNILKIISDSSGSLNEGALESHASLPKVELDFHLQELVNNKILSKRYDVDYGEIVYNLTQEGRRVIISIKNSKVVKGDVAN